LAFTHTFLKSFLCVHFSWWIFSSNLNSFGPSTKVFIFLVLTWFFSRIFFWVPTRTFGNFGAKFASYRTKYWEMLFCKQVLEFHLAPFLYFCFSIFSKIYQITSLYLPRTPFPPPPSTDIGILSFCIYRLLQATCGFYVCAKKSKRVLSCCQWPGEKRKKKTIIKC